MKKIVVKLEANQRQVLHIESIGERVEIHIYPQPDSALNKTIFDFVREAKISVRLYGILCYSLSPIETKTLADVVTISKYEWSRKRLMGRKTMAEFEAALAEYGINLSER